MGQLTVSETDTLRPFSARCPNKRGAAVGVFRCRECTHFVKQTADGVICNYR